MHCSNLSDADFKIKNYFNILLKSILFIRVFQINYLIWAFWKLLKIKQAFQTIKNNCQHLVVNRSLTVNQKKSTILLVRDRDLTTLGWCSMLPIFVSDCVTSLTRKRHGLHRQKWRQKMSIHDKSFLFLNANGLLTFFGQHCLPFKVSISMVDK